MKTKILITVLAFIVSGALAFGQVTTKMPKKQVTTTKTEMQKDSVYYTCSMHPDVKMDKPGKCPKCGMALEKKTMSTSETKTIKSDAMKTYTCTMHPDVKSDKPGKCPKCGMALVEKK